MADPGFPPGGCANSKNCYYFSNFCQKLHENERIWIPRGARVPGAPLGSANGGGVTLDATFHRYLSGGTQEIFEPKILVTGMG